MAKVCRLDIRIEQKLMKQFSEYCSEKGASVSSEVRSLMANACYKSQPPRRPSRRKLEQEKESEDLPTLITEPELEPEPEPLLTELEPEDPEETLILKARDYIEDERGRFGMVDRLISPELVAVTFFRPQVLTETIPVSSILKHHPTPVS